ncbi:MAG: hypothetical protein WB791_11425 [Waddliaceae bacterium]
MYQSAVNLFAIALVFFHISAAQLIADGASLEEEQEVESRLNFRSFTGKITRDKVRMRVQPGLDSPVIREMDRGDMVVVNGEEDGFYSVQPPSSMKGYIYRTFVLDGIIEGSRVNIRLDPHLEAPVIAQLNQGDPVEGVLSAANNKWLEIPVPLWARFYVSTDYVENIGDASLLALHERRREEVGKLLDEARRLAQSELEKPVVEMNVEKVVNNDKKVMTEYEDFPEYAAQAKEHLTQFQEMYLKRKIAYLEAKTQPASERGSAPNDPPVEQVRVQKHQNPLIEDPSQEDASLPPHQLYQQWMAWKFSPEVQSRMAPWVPVEASLYVLWKENHDHASIQSFYDDQHSSSVSLKGILEPYDRPMRNKPGDFLLVDRNSRIPLAYLYSTQVNLKDKIGQEIAVVGALRPNHYFAYPAYFVLSVE